MLLCDTYNLKVFKIFANMNTFTNYCIEFLKNKIIKRFWPAKCKIKKSPTKQIPCWEFWCGCLWCYAIYRWWANIKSREIHGFLLLHKHGNKSMRSIVCNPQLVAVCNHFEEMHVINPKEIHLRWWYTVWNANGLHTNPSDWIKKDSPKGDTS